MPAGQLCCLLLIINDHCRAWRRHQASTSRGYPGRNRMDRGRPDILLDIDIIPEALARLVLPASHTSEMATASGMGCDDPLDHRPGLPRIPHLVRMRQSEILSREYAFAEMHSKAYPSGSGI